VTKDMCISLIKPMDSFFLLTVTTVYRRRLKMDSPLAHVLFVDEFPSLESLPSKSQKANKKMKRNDQHHVLILYE
jgi:hypothetical protein